jgi:hypothetical protein
MTSIKTILGAAFLVGALTACGDDSADGAGGGGGEAATTATTTTSAATTSSTTNSGPTSTSTTTGGGGEGPTTTTGTGGEGGAGGEAPVFVFADNDYGDYERVDRHGAVEAGTAGIEAPVGLGDGTNNAIRDEYNASNPEEDVDGEWIAEISASVTFFHDNLDGDLESLNLVPASIADALDQAGPVIVPDTIKYDPSADTRYPNGRALTDEVVDITLAAVLLDLSVEGQTLDSFIGVLNPETNDVDFEEAFPFLAPPHPEPDGEGGAGGGG